MEQQYVEMVVATLLKLAAQEQWEVRHASLMGIQHLLAARTVSAVDNNIIILIIIYGTTMCSYDSFIAVIKELLCLLGAE